MKIAVSASGDTLESNVDVRFGRCPYFLLVDIEDKKIRGFKAVENEAGMQGHGAGIGAAQAIGNLKAEKVITGNLGPNAANVLQQIGIKAYSGSGVVKDCVQQLIEGKLEKMGANVQGHFGMPTAPEAKSRKVAVSSDSGEVSEHFGRCPEFTIAEIRGSKIVSKKVIQNPGHSTGFLPKFLKENGVETVIAGGAGFRAKELFKEFGIDMITGVSGSVDEVLDSLADGSLKQGDDTCSPSSGRGYGIKKEDGNE